MWWAFGSRGRNRRARLEQRGDRPSTWCASHSPLPLYPSPVSYLLPALSCSALVTPPRPFTFSLVFCFSIDKLFPRRRANLVCGAQVSQPSPSWGCFRLSGCSSSPPTLYSTFGHSCLISPLSPLVSTSSLPLRHSFSCALAPQDLSVHSSLSLFFYFLKCWELKRGAVFIWLMWLS